MGSAPLKNNFPSLLQFRQPYGIMESVPRNIKTCEVCGNFDTVSPCPICSSQTRDSSIVCVVRDVADLWAMERVSLFKGKYHVLGGVLSAMEGVVPEDLNIESLEKRIASGEVKAKSELLDKHELAIFKDGVPF